MAPQQDGRDRRARQADGAERPIGIRRPGTECLGDHRAMAAAVTHTASGRWRSGKSSLSGRWGAGGGIQGLDATAWRSLIRARLYANGGLSPNLTHPRAADGSMERRNRFGSTPIRTVTATIGTSTNHSRGVRSISAAFFSLLTGP